MKKWFKKFGKQIYRFRSAIGFGLAGLAVILSFTAGNYKYKHKKFKQLDINITDNDAYTFVDQAAIKAMIGNHYTDELIGQSQEAVRLERIEEIIQNNPYIREVKVYTGINGALKIEIQQREPMVRVINKGAVDYYIDKKGLRMPLSNKFTARVLVANGHIYDPNPGQDTIRSGMINKVRKLARFIYEKPYWKVQIEQVYVNRQQEFELVPRIGSHTIILGDTSRMRQKFLKLKTFYHESLEHIGWNKYKTINLKFKDQIVAQKF